MADIIVLAQNLGVNNMKDTKQVNFPSMFSIEYGNKTSYLLGTNHVLPLSALPHQCIEIINSCSALVTEESSHDMEEYYTKAILRDPNSPSWLEKLPKEIAEFMEKLIDTVYNEFDPQYRKKADELEIWAAYQSAIQGWMIQLTRNQSTEQGEIGLCMDQELMLLDVFAGNVEGLEGNIDKIPRYKREANSINDIVTFYHQAVAELEKVKEYTNDDEGDNIGSTINSYCSNASLFRMSDATFENNDKDTIERNLNWIPNILKFHKQLSGSVLFAVGHCHLLGENGLLSLLPSAGARIRILTYDGTFEDYLYPFSSANICKMALLHERFILRCFKDIDKDNVEKMSSAYPRTLGLANTTTNAELSEETISYLKKSKLRGCFVC